jgi:lipoate-protein ligase B
VAAGACRTVASARIQRATTARRGRIRSVSSVLEVRDLGTVDYAKAMELQDALVEARLRDAIPDTLLLLEHPPVITLGRRGSPGDIYATAADLARHGIAVEHTSRGGLVTYHGPGQLVGYPIVHLRDRGMRLPIYVRALEQAIIDALEEIGVDARVDADHIGVWTSHGKIAAIGIAQRHGVSLHGFAVNLQPDLSHFGLINPCGIGDLGVTSAAAILGQPVDIADFKLRIARSVEAHLERVAHDPLDAFTLKAEAGLQQR